MRALFALPIIAGGLALAARARATTSTSSSTGSSGATVTDATLEALAMTVRRVLAQPWALPASAEPYRLNIQAAEGRHAIPAGLLGRLLYQESRFRADIISGATPSPAGALGIAQIVPRWHPNVDPLNPRASIDYAANYLASLKSQFGTWQLALAAYNWGMGNLRTAIDKHGAFAVLTHPETPKETRDYVAQIVADVPVGIRV